MSTPLRIAFLGAAFAVLAGLNLSATAAPIPLVNPDFEVDLAADPDGFNPAKTGWGLPFDGFGVRASGSTDPGPAAGAAFSGENNYLQLQASDNVGGPLAGVSFVGGSQTVATTVMANTRYTLSIDVARDQRVTFPSIIPSNDVYLGFAGGPTTLVRLFRTATGTGLGEAAGVTLVSTSPVPAAGGITTWTRVYETNGSPDGLGGALTLQLFVQSNTAGGTVEALFDNVALDVSAIPEPGSIALLGLGGLGLAAVRRRGDSRR